MQFTTLYYISKSLEIFGFLLATIFGTILLNPEIAGRFAKFLKVKASNSSDRLVKSLEFTYKPLKFALGLEEQPESPLKGCLGAIFLRGLAIMCIIIGWAIDNTWVLWAGIAIAAPYVLLQIILSFVRVWRFGVKGVLLYPIILLLGLVVSFFIAPVGLFLYMIVLYILLIITLLVALITSEDNLKKGFLILGSSMVLVGLILELIATL